MKFPSRTYPGHWCGTAYSYEAADALDRHLRPGGPVRMAMLLHLSRYPEGVSQNALRAVVRGALPPKVAEPSEEDMQVLCGHLLAEGLLGVEFGDQGFRYFSPAARRVSRLRRLHGHLLPPGLQPSRAAS